MAHLGNGTVQGEVCPIRSWQSGHLDTGSKRPGREWNVRIPALTMQAGRGWAVEMDVGCCVLVLALTDGMVSLQSRKAWVFMKWKAGAVVTRCDAMRHARCSRCNFASGLVWSGWVMVATMMVMMTLRGGMDSPREKNMHELSIKSLTGIRLVLRRQ